VSRKKIEHRIFKRGPNQRVPLTKDNAGTGSVEIKHMDFSETSNLVDINDADVIALRDTSDSNGMKAVKLGDFKSYVSGSQATGRTGSIQFNNGDDFGGALGLTTDGIHLTASAKLNPGTYVIRLTSGSTGRFGNKTYGPVNNTAQVIHCVGTGSSDFVFFLSNGSSTNAPSAQSVNFTGTAQEIRVEAHSGITDWRNVAANFFEKMKAQLDTNTGIATVTSSSAGSIAGTASITIAYNTLGGGVRIGGGRNVGRALHDPHSQPTSTGPFNASMDPSAGTSPIQTGGSSGQNGEPNHNGGFVQTTTSGSDPIQTQFYFTNAALGNSPKHQRIFTDADGNIKVEAANTGSGIVEVRGGTGVRVRTVTNKGFIFGNIGSNPALKDARDFANVQRASIQFDTDDNAHPVITFASGTTDIISSRVQTESGSAGTYVFRLTSGSIKAVGHTYGPAGSNLPQYLEVFSSGSERFLFFPSDGTSTALPTANGLQIDTTIGNANARQIRVEAKSGITDWRDVADNFFEQMKLELQTKRSLATITSSSAGSITATASITVAYASLVGGVAVGSGKVTISGAPNDSTRLMQPQSRKGDVAAANASSAQVQLANNAGVEFKNSNSPESNTGVFVETVSSGSSDTFSGHMNLRQANAKLLFDNGTTYFVGKSTNVQYLTASAAKIGTLDVEEIVSRSTTKDSLELKDKLVIAGVSGSKHANFVGAGFQLGGKVGAQGTGSAPIFSVTLGDAAVNKGSMLFNVANTRIASLNSGSHYSSAGNVGDGVYAVTGALSASFARAQFVSAGTVTASAGTFQRIVTNKLAGDGIITVDNIGTGSVGTPQLAALGVTTAKIAVGAVGIDQLATGSVFTPQLTTAGITKAKIATGAVTLDKLATGSVTTPQIGALAVTHAKISEKKAASGNTILDFGNMSNFGLASVSVNETIKISDGTRTLTFTAVNGGGSSVTGALDFGVGGDRATTATVQELSTKINNSALNSIAQRSGNTIVMTPSASVTLTVQEDPSPGNNVFGSAANKLIVSNSVAATEAAVRNDNFGTGSINTAQLANVSVTHAKIGIGAVERDNFGSGSIFHGHINGAVFTADTFQTGAINTPHFADGAVGIDALATGSVGIKQLNQELVRNGSDAHGGLTIGTSRLAINYVRRNFARSDGSNISGSVATKGSFASDAIPTPYTTASLAAQPMSGTVEVYFNGVLLLGDHPGADAGGPTSADYRVITSSAGAYKIQLAEDLALDSDDILTVTYYSGSNPA
jgi:hypothetical protein